MLSAIACARTFFAFGSLLVRGLDVVHLEDIYAAQTFEHGAERTPFSVVDEIAPIRRGSKPGPIRRQKAPKVTLSKYCGLRLPRLLACSSSVEPGKLLHDISHTSCRGVPEHGSVPKPISRGANSLSSISLSAWRSHNPCLPGRFRKHRPPRRRKPSGRRRANPQDRGSYARPAPCATRSARRDARQPKRRR